MEDAGDAGGRVGLRWIRRVALGLAFLAFVVLAARYVPGSQPPAPARFEVIAHRGVHQTAAVDVGLSGCTAANIHPVRHHLIENTLPSMQAAFDFGASMVEIDVHPTADGGMIVFHDWTVDCQTDGQGQTDQLTLAYLKTLDVGYGYTADGGRTFPLRGRGAGMMPTLGEVLEHFPDRRFLVNQKDRHERTLPILARVLQDFSREQRARLHYTGPFPEVARRLIPDLGGMFQGRSQMKTCGKQFVWRLGVGPWPAACGTGDITLPPWATPYIWGWPNRFLSSARGGGSRVFLYLNRPEDGREVLDVPIDGIVTDRIEVVGPWLKASGRIS